MELNMIKKLILQARKILKNDQKHQIYNKQNTENNIITNLQ